MLTQLLHASQSPPSDAAPHHPVARKKQGQENHFRLFDGLSASATPTTSGRETPEMVRFVLVFLNNSSLVRKLLLPIHETPSSVPHPHCGGLTSPSPPAP